MNGHRKCLRNQFRLSYFGWSHRWSTSSKKSLRFPSESKIYDSIFTITICCVHWTVWTWMKAGCDDDPCLFSWLPQLKKNWVGGWNMRTLNDTALFPLGKFLTSMKQVEKYLSIFLIRLAGTYQHCQIEWFIIELSHELWTSLSKDYVGMELYVVRPEKHAMS